MTHFITTHLGTPTPPGFSCMVVPAVPVAESLGVPAEPAVAEWQDVEHVGLPVDQLVLVVVLAGAAEVETEEVVEVEVVEEIRLELD